MPTYTTSQVCDRVGGRLEGPSDTPIRGVESLHHAQSGQISFIGDSQHCSYWPVSSASAALISMGLVVPGGDGRALIRVQDADLAVAVVLEMFAPPTAVVNAGVHCGAVVDGSASLGEAVSIGANSVIGPRTCIGDRTVIYANVTILDDVRLGAGCVVWPGVVIRERTEIGDRCILHPNVTIGADGFGYRPAPDGTKLVKILQIGTVQIGHDVEIGAGSCVDRGKFSATRIGDGTKIDNLCQIAHNCEIGRHCILAGQVGLAGSVTVGDGVVMGGQVAIKDHTTIGAGAKLAACSAVMNEVPPGETWGGLPAREFRAARREYAAVRKLPDLVRSLKKK